MSALGKPLSARHRRNTRIRGQHLLCALLVFAGLAVTVQARADANDYVHLPGVVAGEREIDLKWGRQQERAGGTTAAGSIGFGYGVNETWFTELYGKWEREAGTGTRFDATEWENRFALTEPGKYPIDLGWLLEIERPVQRANGYEISTGPLLQAQAGRWQGNLNLLLRRHLRGTESAPAELHYESQLRYRSNPQLDWGVQALGSFGAAGADPESISRGRTHLLGPAWFGRIRMAGHSAVVWNAAVLFRVGAGASGTTARIQTEYEF